MRTSLFCMFKNMTTLEAMVNTILPLNSYPKLVLTCSDIPENYISLLQKKCDVSVCRGTTREDILNSVVGAEGILWLTADKLNSEVLERAGPKLKVVSTLTSGMDYVDPLPFKERGVALGHTPKVVNNPVADIAIGLMIAAARRFHEGRMKILHSQWEQRPQWMLGRDIIGSTVGIVGFGGIGQAIAKRLQGFDVAKLLYSGRSIKSEAARYSAQLVSFEDLLCKSDFIFISCPLTSETTGLFNDNAFSKMKPTSVLINVARGGIVDQTALVKALSTGQIFAAGLDVMTPEPLPCNDSLLDLHNAVIVPHLGTATTKSLEDMFCIATQNVLSVLAGGLPVAPFI